jgi:hypothetical protein
MRKKPSVLNFILLKKTLLACLLPLGIFAQSTSLIGGQIGVNIQFGSHINQIGIGGNAYWLTPYFQVNLATNFSFYAQGLGPQKSFIECKSQAGLILLGGKNTQRTNLFFNPMFQQSKHDFALGYSYIYYWDNRKTQQFSGAFVAQVKQFSLIFENDLFAGGGRDRFRTAKVQLYWKDSLNLAKIGISLWTGETRGAPKKTDENSGVFYKDLSQQLYGTASNGILSFGYRRALIFQQSLGFDIGVDAEQIRNAFQNKLVHNALQKSKKNGASNPQYPMLCKDGSPYLFQSQQRIKKPRFYIELGTGNN